MPDHSRHDRSPADDGLYLVPYWVQGGRFWIVILAVLVGGGVILPFSAAWFGRRALEHRLVDELKTSDEYIIGRCDEMDVFHIRYVIHKHRLERFMDKLASIAAPKAVLNKELIH